MEHNATITITVSQLKYALDEFSGAVYQQKAPKMNYESWRRLKGIIETLGTIIPITFRPNGENCDGYKKYFVDCSKGGLGSYPITVPEKFVDLLQEIETDNANIYPCINNPSNIIQKEEEKTMNIPIMKFDFGPADSNYVAMSPYGLAIQYNGSWYAYNAKEDQTIDVTGMTFSFKNTIYKMPVAVNQIAVGDLIYHQKRPMYVIAAPEGASIKVIDLAASEQKTVIPVANMFGFNYVTKIAPLFNLGTITPSTDNPFGNIMPMMMMSSLFEDNKSDNDVMQMMLMMSLMNGNNPFAAIFAGGSSNAQ